MKKIIIASLFLLISFKIFAQSSKTSISGTITDAKKSPVESAPISLMTASDSSLVKMAVTDKSGRYSFASVPNSKYFVSVSSVNFLPNNSPYFELDSSTLSKALVPIVLEGEPKSLVAVVVSAKKPLIEQKIDRMVINVDAAVTNVGSTAMEVLEKSPGITVGQNGNISLKGKAEVMVMIDGKPFYLSSSDLANLLGSMNSNQLSQIEIMTNPSAKNEAAGNAGVINIKTKKTKPMVSMEI